VAEITAATRQVAEGVKSCRSVLELAQRTGVEMPITEQVVRVVHGGEAAADMVKELMTRETKPE
jgi:glycerol-3-phosphate dehydrogenase (NAD(P)+)